MQHATQVTLTRRVIDFVERDTTELAQSVFLNPVSTYTCPEQAQREQHMLFRGHPLFFGLSCELPNPGDFRADDLSGVPILVVRGRDGQLNAFLNVCRHRGAKIATGSGSGKRLFVCPYHAWTYDLDGRLTRLNPEAGFPGITCAERSLVPLPVAEKHGLIFVQATPGVAFRRGCTAGRAGTRVRLLQSLELQPLPDANPRQGHELEARHRHVP